MVVFPAGVNNPDRNPITATAISRERWVLSKNPPANVSRHDKNRRNHNEGTIFTTIATKKSSGSISNPSVDSPNDFLMKLAALNRNDFAPKRKLQLEMAREADWHHRFKRFESNCEALIKEKHFLEMQCV